MIDLRVKVDPPPLDHPTVVRLRETFDGLPGPHDALLIDRADDRREYDFCGFSLVVYGDAGMPLDNDVLLLAPGQRSAARIIRASSAHNTLLITEQCDQLCVMCSQPPKKHHVDMFAQLETAASLAPAGAYIGISGGEPLLHKQALFSMLENLAADRPDLRFHILSNGQHFEPDDVDRLVAIGPERILWGIPLYSPDPSNHDAIVGKVGAYHRLMRSMVLLMRSGAAVELRTVVLRQNWQELPALAEQIATRLPFIDRWAIMHLENIGYGRMNWHLSFKDTSSDFGMLGRAIDIATARDTTVTLYNFPLCSLPAAYRVLAPRTISDWKNKHEVFCDGCSAQSDCGGFFQWYDHKNGFSRLGAL
ncbi:His-Xaa-Ser system radical SAM maturase HxsC [Neorhizobium sp. BT27B]|uniref:His-Xaa-Ser system radical SAM maturase HxsC n=1 Tax=Neorhizobium sp. BT27B TaxID=3142625 RepID=UPI003D2DD292